MDDKAYDAMKSDIERRVEATPEDPVRGDSARSDRIVVVDVNNDTFGFAYVHLVWLVLTATGKLVLRFSTHSVTVEGGGLDVLHTQLLRKEVSELRAHKKDLRSWGVSKEPFIKSVYVLQQDAEASEESKPWPGGPDLPAEPDTKGA